MKRQCQLDYMKMYFQHLAFTHKLYIARSIDSIAQLTLLNYLFNVNNNNTTKRCEICPKLAMKTSEPRQWRHSGVFIVNFEDTVKRPNSGCPK